MVLVLGLVAAFPCSFDLLQTPDMYELRMADEDWDPDLDFPGLDSCAVITDVGVDQFVLCHQVCNWRWV